MTEQQILESISPEPNSGCWLWTRALDAYGYGAVNFDGKTRKSHQVVYEMHKGKIPNGTELDHKCRLTCCVNPDHLEPVTHKVNMSRGIRWQSQKTHCPQGHAYAEHGKPERGGKARRCRICSREAIQRWKRS